MSVSVTPADTFPKAESPFEPFLRAQGVVILDGGLATALEAQGQDLNDPLWSARVLLDAPGTVRRVHLDYLAAGADCIATVTYQATFEGMARRGLTDMESEEVLRSAVTLAVEARDAFWAEPSNRQGRIRPLVAASVGPYGAYLADGSEYSGAYGLSEEALYEFHRRRWHVLADAGADLMGCETIPSAVEAGALLRLLAETPGGWAWLSFQCRDGAHVADGTPLADVVRLCSRAERVVGVGVNCVPPRLVDTLLDAALSEARAPFMVYPNSGEAYDSTSKAWGSGGAGPDPAEAAQGWRNRGASVLGGCCRTGPDTIARMRKSLLGAWGTSGAPA
ncbi:MAG: homocysteine S-methyltransferase [Gemmatimonadetes bacterium]|nr:homocysteine S-methyltransferase [Gemmatimonadota bacterium]